MTVEQSPSGLWLVLGEDRKMLASFATNGEAWRWVERNEFDPIWVKSIRQNRVAIGEYRRQKESKK